MKNETKTIDDIECVYCGHKFDGSAACNYDMDCRTVDCPKCGKEMEVSISVEFLCHPIE